jgi:hypothetical protein
MPYFSRAERERSLWCTIPDAIEHICSIDHCNELAARRQLRDGLADGALGRLRWENPPRVPNMAGLRPEWGAGAPPPKHLHWTDIDIDWNAGTVFDDFDLITEARAVGVAEWRILLINRRGLAGLWPKPSQPPFHAGQDPSITEVSVSPDTDYPDPPWVMQKQARERRISRFREHQQRRRNWISLADIADWIARDRGATDRRDEKLRAQGYDDLLNAILIGEFERGNRSCVLYLTPDAELFRLSAELLRDMRDVHADPATVNNEVLSRCWVPRDLAQRWFERRHLMWPGLFDPVKPVTSRNAATSLLMPDQSGSGMPRTKVPDPEVEAWYIGYCTTAIAQGLRPSEAKDLIAAKAEFGERFRREQIRALRRQHAPEEWRKQGRRPRTKRRTENAAI